MQQVLIHHPLLKKTDLANLKSDAYKWDIASFDNKLKKVNKKVTSNETKNVLVENLLKKTTNIWFNSFIGQIYFNNDRAQLYLIFQPVYKTISIFSNYPGIVSKWV